VSQTSIQISREADIIYFDFETRGVVDLIKLGVTRYAEDPFTQVLCAAWAFDNEEEVHLWNRDHSWRPADPIPEELIDRIASGELFEAHNAMFEFKIWNQVLLREYPGFKVKLDREQMRCSAAKGSCMSLPRALGDAVRAVNLPEKKLEDGKRLINKLSKPRPRRKGEPWPQFCEEEIEHQRNGEYCRQDVRAERGYSNFLPEMTERELEYWQMDWRMNERGITLDVEAATEAIELCAKETERLDIEMQQITGGEVLGGSKRKPFRKWINDQNLIYLPDTRADTLSFALHGIPTKGGDEAKAAIKPKMDEQWAGFGVPGEQVHRALEISMEVNRTSVSKYRQMIASVTDDGRLHDIMLYNGADRTGRWSGKGVQPHNFVRGYSKEMSEVWDDILTLDLSVTTIIWGESLPMFAKACRGALIASAGCELYAADFNAIEARKLAWMAGCASLLNLFNTPGGDPYIAMAKEIYSFDWLDLADKAAIRQFKEDHKTERNLGKKAVLGLGYAMGWEKFQMTVWMDEGIWLEDEFCQMVVKTYRKTMYPEIPALWKAVEKAAIAAVQNPGEEYYAGGDAFGLGAISYFMSDDRNFLHCRLPSGRLLAYLYPEVHTRTTYRFNAINAHGNPCVVSFPAKNGVAMHKVRYHAEKLAEKQKKRLTPEPPESFQSPHLSFMGRNIITKQWQRCGTHGGSLTENADQASSRDLLAEAMFRVDSIDVFDLLLSIHDEVIAEAPIGTCTLHEFESIMSEVPLWAPGMPIAAEGWIGQRLRK